VSSHFRTASAFAVRTLRPCLFPTGFFVPFIAALLRRSLISDQPVMLLRLPKRSSNSYSGFEHVLAADVHDVQAGTGVSSW
jgi:hypothetical protein